jgi:hypothetical protein
MSARPYAGPPARPGRYANAETGAIQRLVSIKKDLVDDSPSQPPISGLASMKCQREQSLDDLAKEWV